ncbi:uncharacterized protein LOC144073632 [Stigmatopora argus]
MDVQLATVLSGGSPEIQNGSQCDLLSDEPKGDRQGSASETTIAGSLRLLPINQDAVSITRTKPEVGGTCEFSTQEKSETHGSRQPIRIQIMVSPLCQTPSASPTKDPHFGSARKTNQISIVETNDQRLALTARTPGGDVSDAETALSDLSSTVKATHEVSGLKLPDLEVKEERFEKPVEDSLKDVVWVGEQTEPLDLSLPKKRENSDHRHGRLLDTCDNLLIMEVDEYEGEGDRDVVEEDEEALPFFYPASVFQDLLLIDDQGIPYTLSPDGLRVPQVDTAASVLRHETEGSSGTPDPSPNLANAPHGDGLSESPSTTQQVGEVLSGSSSEVSGLTVPNQAIQILTMPSSNAPILLPSTPLSLSVTPATAGSPAPIFLFLSSGDSASTPFAILDPSTGQLSQISLPLASGPALPQPVMGLGLSNSPVILSGAPGSTLTSSLPATSIIPSHVDSPVGTEAIPAEQVSNESDKPSSLRAAAATLTLEPSVAPSPDPQVDPERLPLDDHMYFSSLAAPPSPPTLEALDPSDPLLDTESPDDPAARRVLYCQLCPRIFFYLSDLERHAITHSQKKPHVCLQCNKAFKRSSHLQRHKHIHTGQRNFVCPICSKRFREAGELQRHQRVHTGEKPYQCQLCHTRFAERNTLRRHTKRKHPFHQVAVEMLNERGGGGADAIRQGEEPAEWYSSAVAHLGNSDSETET